MVASSAAPAVQAGAGGQAGPSQYEQEVKLEKLFGDLRAGFQKMQGITDPNKQSNLLKDLTNKMQEAKRYLLGQCSASLPYPLLVVRDRQSTLQLTRVALC